MRGRRKGTCPSGSDIGWGVPMRGRRKAARAMARGQLSLRQELSAPADSLPGAPVLAEPKRKPVPAPVLAELQPRPKPNPVSEPASVAVAPSQPPAKKRREWTVGEALDALADTPSHRESEMPPGLTVRWPLVAGMPCPKCGAGSAGRRRYQHRGIAVSVCLPCGNSGDTLMRLATVLDSALADASGLC